MSVKSGTETFDELVSSTLPSLVAEVIADRGCLYRSVMARVEQPLLRYALELCARQSAQGGEATRHQSEHLAQAAQAARPLAGRGPERSEDGRPAGLARKIREKWKKKSHRASRRCYRSGSESFLSPKARRLDGYSLYSANHIPGFEPKGKPIVAAFDTPHASTDGGAVLLKSPRHALAADEARGGVCGGPAPAGQGAAPDAGIAAAAGVRARLRLCRRQRRRAAGRRCDPQAAARPRSDRRCPRWRRSRRCRDSRTRWGWAQLRDMAHVLADTVIETHRRRLKAKPPGSRSTSIPPTIRRMASRSSRSSTVTTTRGATCRLSRR